MDCWGCRFENLQEGVIGEVKEALVKDEDWEDTDTIHIPTEWLDFDVDAVNRFCRGTDKFVIAGSCPRPFEQLQFIRTTEELYMDLVYPPENLKKFMRKMHTFYCDLLEKWAKTEVDAFNSQIFCMGLDNLAQYKGKITFWGEIDRQHLLPEGSTQDIRNAVKEVHEKLWSNGGCIAQCEFGAGANPDNVYSVFQTWDEITK